MSRDLPDYGVAFGEINKAWRELGDSPAFWRACDAIEDRLIESCPDDEVAIIEAVATWLVHLGVQPQTSLQGYV